MRKQLTFVLAAVLAIGICVPAFTAVESVKVGGDVLTYGAMRKDFDFLKNSYAKDTQHFFQTSTRIYVTANLSENVSAMVRLINERAWGRTSSFPGFPNVGRSVDVDLAYVKLSDLLTPGLALTVGRQEIQFGEGLVVGSAYNAFGYPVGLAAPDLGVQKAFDAIKVDYALSAFPMGVTFFGAKINEALIEGRIEPPPPFVFVNHDQDLYGIDLTQKLEILGLEEYYVLLHTSNAQTLVDKGSVGTFGVRATLALPMVQGLSFKGEFAKQAGKVTLPIVGGTDDFRATGWAGYVAANYAFPVAMKPAVGLGYSMFSGSKASDSKIKNWIPIAPSGTADRVGDIAYAALLGAGESTAFGGAGLRVWKLDATIQPIDKLALGLRYYLLDTDRKWGSTVAGVTLDKSRLGQEVDFNVDYNFTEDLAFGLDLGTFMRGSAIKKWAEQSGAGGETANPWQAVLSMKLAF